MDHIKWTPDDTPAYHEGYEGGAVEKHLNLTAIHGETEFLRHGFARDVDGDGHRELITRTLNANRSRAIDLTDGSTEWLSPAIDPPPRESVQISDIAVADLDEDGKPEVLLATYQGSVICLDGTDGSVAWHRRLGFLINNSRLGSNPILPGPGGNIALTVGRGTKPVGPGPYWRNNRIFNPQLMILDHAGEIEVLTAPYAEHNSDGHYTWTGDINGDGFHEVACVGEEEVVWFDGSGDQLFSVPTPGESGHPDDLHVIDLYPDRAGREIVYLDGYTGVNVYSQSGTLLRERTYPSEVASHLQLLAPHRTPDGPRIAGANIRSLDSKLLMLDGDLNPIWALEADPSLMFPQWIDWDGDGEQELLVGSNSANADWCTFRVMNRDGTPLYWHRIDGHQLCWPLEVVDLDGDGRDEVVVGVGDKDGSNGRWSLPEGSDMHLLVFDPEVAA